MVEDTEGTLAMEQRRQSTGVMSADVMIITMIEIIGGMIEMRKDNLHQSLWVHLQWMEPVVNLNFSRGIIVAQGQAGSN
jgi:hypothetical protein